MKCTKYFLNNIYTKISFIILLPKFNINKFNINYLYHYLFLFYLNFRIEVHLTDIFRNLLHEYLIHDFFFLLNLWFMLTFRLIYTILYYFLRNKSHFKNCLVEEGVYLETVSFQSIGKTDMLFHIHFR